MMKWWEDFEVGSAVDIGKHTFGADEIVAFGRQFDPQPYHADPAAAKNSPFGGLIASGWHVCAAGMRMLTERVLGQAHTLGSPGIENVRWLKPVRAGDTLTGHVEIADKAPSKSRPQMGIVHEHWIVTNQKGEVVMTTKGINMVRRRPA